MDFYDHMMVPATSSHGVSEGDRAWEEEQEKSSECLYYTELHLGWQY